MRRRLAQKTLESLGWTFDNHLPTDLQQCVMIAAPHTSNWDSVYTKLAFIVMDIPVKITIKDSYMKPPFGVFVRAMGGIGIDRSPRQAGEERPSMVQAMASLFQTHPRLVMLVTPEATRAKQQQWKTGFYYVALAANVPIALAYLDYAKKEAGIGKIIYPTGHIEQDLGEIMAFYQGIQGKHPANFSVDERYIR
ncbi:MAG: 1-acyl-sn-glycerol-3-phosphate acyltransferase [Pseudomonadota bacterium]|nr:1-acyl-sn-glycerol-3-phosphate acyltransferase [Pseudomonadota bacterium]